MPIRLTTFNNSSSTSTSFKSKTNMSSKVISYDIDFINSFRYKINRPLPERVMRTLNMSTKIKAVMNEKDLKIFNRKLDNFDEKALKKKLHSLLNKIAKQNIDTIFQKVSEILKNRKVLIKYAIKMLITNVVSMPFLVDTYAAFYKKLYNKETEEIFQETFKELLEVLSGKVNSEVNSATDYNKFCEYLEDKTKYSGLFVFMSSLYDLKIIKKKQVKYYLKFLEDTILKSSKSDNEKYAETYSKFVQKLNNKQFINLKKINEIKNAGVLSMRCKFMIMDLSDLAKKLSK